MCFQCHKQKIKRVAVALAVGKEVDPVFKVKLNSGYGQGARKGLAAQDFSKCLYIYK